MFLLVCIKLHLITNQLDRGNHMRFEMLTAVLVKIPLF